MKSSKSMTEYQKFRECLKEMEVKGAGLTDKYVIIPRKMWDNSQRRYNEFMQIQRAIHGRVN